MSNYGLVLGVEEKVEKPVSGEKKVTWYKVINDILPTNDRLYKIRITPRIDAATVTNKTLSCTGSRSAGRGTNMDMDERENDVDTSDNPGEDTERMACETSFHNIAPTPRRAMQWILTNVVFFRTQFQREQNSHFFIDFLKRSKLKMYQQSNRRECVGNYLTIIDKEG